MMVPGSTRFSESTSSVFDAETASTFSSIGAVDVSEETEIFVEPAYPYCCSHGRSVGKEIIALYTADRTDSDGGPTYGESRRPMSCRIEHNKVEGLRAPDIAQTVYQCLSGLSAFANRRRGCRN